MSLVTLTVYKSLELMMREEFDAILLFDSMTYGYGL